MIKYYPVKILRSLVSRTMSEFIKEKEKYLNRTMEERTAKGAATLNDIPTWTDIFLKKKPAVKEIEKGNYEENPEINKKVSFWDGDITKLAIDAIVNAANERMLGGGGVDGAIHKAAGRLLKEECKTHNGCKTGDAKITGGYELPAKYVIHTVGPRGEKPEMLSSCYFRSLTLAQENNLRSIAFPCISTGVFGYPNEAAANVALKTVRDYLEKNHDKFDRVIFCLFLPVDIAIYEKLMPQYFPISASKL